MKVLAQVLGLTSLVLFGGVALATPQKGRVMFWYDTEDYVSESAPDAALFHANLLTEQGWRGNFAVVGFYAQRLQERGRADVIAALRRHCIGSQTLYHSRHPTICEYTDVAEWSEQRCLAEESECIGMLRGVFGLDAVRFFVPPGSSVTPVAMYAYADRGAKVYGGGIDIFGDAQFDRLAWYCNMLHVPYIYAAGGDCAGVPGNDALARRNLTAIFTHPCQLDTAEFWDAANYAGTNAVAWRTWKAPKMLPAEKRTANRAAWRALMRRIKDDKRLTVVSCDDLIREVKPRVPITRAHVPMLLAAMEKGLEPIESPASWCVSDVFQAAVAFLKGEETYMPSKAWGFVRKPMGVNAPMTVKRDDLVWAAKRMQPGFVPAHVIVGGAANAQSIGPADFLVAALKVLATGAEEVTITPRDQVGPIGKHLKSLPKLKLTRDAWCIYAYDFKDQYVSDRLRWQFWTLRYEE